ncbi:BrnA antitoxin family protein [Treponema succinifaciens]
MPVKQTVTMRLDADLVAALRSFGKGYQSKTMFQIFFFHRFFLKFV